MKNGKFILRILAAAVMTFLLCGCSVSQENTDAGMLAIGQMDYETALMHFDEAEKQGENLRLISRGRGIAYMGLTEYEEASACFEEALRLSSGLLQPVDYDLNYYLAASYTKEERFGDAEAVYGAILNMKPEETQAYFLRGNVRMELGKDDEATADFDRAAALEPENYDLLIQIYEVLANYRQEEQGKIYLQSALEREDNKLSVYDKGRIYYYLGEYQKACLALEEAKDRHGASAYLYLGRAYEATGDYNYASSVYNAYLTKDSTNAEMYNQLGLCEMKKGEYEKALDAFQSGLGVENQNIRQTLAYNEIVAYEYLGDFQKATVLMKTYLKNYPDDENAQREYEFLSTR